MEALNDLHLTLKFGHPDNLSIVACGSHNRHTQILSMRRHTLIASEVSLRTF